MNGVLMDKALIEGFGPISRPDATRLILGTIPGRESLEKGQYYAYSRNAFWFIIESLLSNKSVSDYSLRKNLLIQAKIALWAVLPFISPGRRLSFISLPSTSTANARLTPNEKLSAWRALVNHRV